MRLHDSVLAQCRRKAWGWRLDWVRGHRYIGWWDILAAAEIQVSGGHICHWHSRRRLGSVPGPALGPGFATYTMRDPTKRLRVLTREEVARKYARIQGENWAEALDDAEAQLQATQELLASMRSRYGITQSGAYKDDHES